jgi:hypothetical protein
MQYDFNLAANASQKTEIVGTYFKYVTGVGKIRVRLNTGQYIDLLPGQAVKGKRYTSIDIQDRSGLPNSGTFFADDFDFTDDSISGTISTINNSKRDTLLGSGFMIGTGAGNGAEGNGVSLCNPAGNTKNLIVKKVLCTITNGANSWVGWNVAMAAASPIKAGNKLSGGALSTGVVSAETRTGAQQGALGQTHILVLAGGVNLLVFDEPIVVRPGYGLLCLLAIQYGAVVAGAAGAFGFEWREDDI